MKNKFFILVILIFVLSSSTVFGATVPEMSIEMAEYIIDYFSENADGFSIKSNVNEENLLNIKTILNNTNPNILKNYFNSNFKNILEQNDSTKDFIIDFNNITVYSRLISNNQCDLIFVISNNTAPNNNNFSYQLTQFTGLQTCELKENNPENSSAWYFEINIKENNYIGNSLIYRLQNKPITLYYFNENNRTYDNEKEICYIINQLALSQTQISYVSDFSIGQYTSKSYFIGNIYEITPPSGDNESGDTGGGSTNPSGDTPGTTTPDYNEKLDNIQTGINNIENKIPTSGEVQEVISGTLNEAFGEGSGEVTSEQINNLQEDVNEIMGDIVPANNFIGMFNQIISAFSEALLGQGEETIEFEHRGEYYVISSNQVNLPIAEIKGFLSIFFNVAIVMAMALTISWIIRRMEEGNLISVLHMGDADMYFYEDLNLF